MSSLWQLPAVVVAVLGWLTAPAASIGDAAWKEALRRQVTAKSVRQYTNRDLPQVVFVARKDGSEVAADESVGVPVSGDMLRSSEQTWRDRAAQSRANLERDELLTQSVQSRVNQLTADIVNRDDPYQQAQLREQLQKLVIELDRLQKLVLSDRKAIDVLSDEARRAGVPPGWVR
jgi:hypothetical protein